MKTILITIYALHLCLVVMSQKEVDFFNSPYVGRYSNVIPQTPNAISFANYGNIPEDYSTGTFGTLFGENFIYRKSQL